jgi:hypothetical protein
MVVWLIVAAAVVAVFAAAVRIDLRARRHGRRVRLTQADINRARRAEIDQLNQHAPSGHYLHNRFGG